LPTLGYFERVGRHRRAFFILTRLARGDAGVVNGKWCVAFKSSRRALPGLCWMSVSENIRTSPCKIARLTTLQEAPMAKPNKPASFESAMSELENLIAEMERGDQPLEASLAAYKRGGELIRFCQGQLSAAEQQIKVLDGDTLKPFDAEDGE
jgi:exodeoxyribonuclease VII small subunit